MAGNLPAVCICSRANAATAPLLGNVPSCESGFSTSYAEPGGGETEVEGGSTLAISMPNTRDCTSPVDLDLWSGCPLLTVTVVSGVLSCNQESRVRQTDCAKTDVQRLEGKWREYRGSCISFVLVVTIAFGWSSSPPRLLQERSSLLESKSLYLCLFYRDQLVDLEVRDLGKSE